MSFRLSAVAVLRLLLFLATLINQAAPAEDCGVWPIRTDENTRDPRLFCEREEPPVDEALAVDEELHSDRVTRAVAVESRIIESQRWDGNLLRTRVRH